MTTCVRKYRLLWESIALALEVPSSVGTYRLLGKALLGWKYRLQWGSTVFCGKAPSRRWKYRLLLESIVPVGKYSLLLGSSFLYEEQARCSVQILHTCGNVQIRAVH